MNRKSVSTKAEACCLDGESGLYTSNHFWSVLGQEMARLDRWERPLVLVIIESAHIDPPGWVAFGRLLRASLRRIDLAARLGPERVAVILPDADAFRVRRWLAALGAELSRHQALTHCRFVCGRAMAKPWEIRQENELLALAEASLAETNSAETPLGSILAQGDFVWASGADVEAEEEADTAIASEERSLLFDGFKTLGALN